MPNVLNDFFESKWLAKTGVATPVINIIGNNKDYEVEVAVPGMIEDDFGANIDENSNLTICMEKKEEKKGEERDKKYLRHELLYSKFQQTIPLSGNVGKDKIPAKVGHRVLSTEISKMREKKK